MTLLKVKRKKAGLSLIELSRRSGIYYTRLWKIENGELRLKVDDVPRLAHAIGCDPADLIPPLDSASVAGEPEEVSHA